MSLEKDIPSRFPTAYRSLVWTECTGVYLSLLRMDDVAKAKQTSSPYGFTFTMQAGKSKIHLPETLLQQIAGLPGINKISGVTISLLTFLACRPRVRLRETKSSEIPKRNAKASPRRTETTSSRVLLKRFFLYCRTKEKWKTRT